MSTVRRQVMRRPSPLAVTPETAHEALRTARRQTQLDADRTAMRRWMTRLKRAFHAIERLERRILRIEKQLRQ